VTGQGLLDRFDAEPGLHRDRQPPGQDAPAEPVDHGGEIDEAACHGNVGQIHGPDLVCDCQVAQQIGIDLVARRRLGSVGLAVNGLDPHPLHQRGDMPATGPEAFGGQQVAQHAATREGEVQMQLVDPAHQREISGRGCPWQIINAAPADVEHLLGDRQIMRTVNHRFALGKPALPGQKIVLQRQLSDLGMQHRQIHRWPGTLAPRLRAEHPSRPVEKLRLPLGDLVGMNVELLS
jgi:hypothetical protein